MHSVLGLGGARLDHFGAVVGFDVLFAHVTYRLLVTTHGSIAVGASRFAWGCILVMISTPRLFLIRQIWVHIFTFFLHSTLLADFELGSYMLVS